MSAGLSGSGRHSREVLQRGEVSSAGLWGADECLQMLPKTRRARAPPEEEFWLYLARVRAARFRS